MSEPQRLDGVTCIYCGATGTIIVEWRDTLQALPTGTYSIAGQTPKVVARTIPWPWARCESCGHESMGRMDSPEGV